MVMKKIGNIGKKICKGLWKGMKDNKEEIFTLSLVVIPALLIQDTSFASDTTGIDSLDTPISKLKSVLTGPVPKAGSTIAVAVGGLGWAMGTEQQITKFATRAAVGGGVAVGSINVVDTVLPQSSGCLF